MNYHWHDLPFLTIVSGKTTLDFVDSKFVDDLFDVYANDVLVFHGYYRDFVYRIHMIPGENYCELNLKRVFKINMNGDALNRRIHTFLQQKKGKR